MTITGKLQNDAGPDQRNFQMHSHTWYEIFCFLAGDAYFMVEGTRYELRPGDVFLMRPGEAHHIVFRSSAPYYRIIITFETPSDIPGHLQRRLLEPFCNRTVGQYNRYAFSQFSGTDLRFLIDKVTNAKNEEQRFCFLLSLLSEIGAAFDKLQKTPDAETRHPVSDILDHINRHLADPLTVEGLCKRFYISKTHINRQFKKNTGATVWEYITVKRLFLSRELLSAGEAPKEVYLKCGYKDYTTFFRAYKKHFGVSPNKYRKSDTPMQLIHF